MPLSKRGQAPFPTLRHSIPIVSPQLGGFQKFDKLKFVGQDTIRYSFAHKVLITPRRHMPRSNPNGSTSHSSCIHVLWFYRDCPAGDRGEDNSHRSPGNRDASRTLRKI